MHWQRCLMHTAGRAERSFTWWGFDPADIEHVDIIISTVTDDVGSLRVQHKPRITSRKCINSCYSYVTVGVPGICDVQDCTILTEPHAHTRTWVRVYLQRNRVMMVSSVILPQIPQLNHSEIKAIKDQACHLFSLWLLNPGSEQHFSPINSSRGDEGVLILK